MHLRNVATEVRTRACAPRPAMQIEAQLCELRIVQPIDAKARRWTVKVDRVGAFADPSCTQRRKPRADIDLHSRIGIRAGRVVNRKRRIVLSAERSRRLALRNLAHWHAQIGTRAFDINLAGLGQRLHCRFINVRRSGDEFRIGAHRFPPAVLTASGSGDSLNRANDAVPPTRGSR